MADTTKIEWTDATWQIVTGCSVVSPGCTNCYAMKLAGTRLRNHPSRKGLTVKTKAGPVWNGKVRFNVGWLKQPIQWRKPRDIFVAAHGDLFHDVVQRWMHVKVWSVMAIASQHRYQVLTKRAERMADFCRWLQTDEGRGALEVEITKQLGSMAPRVPVTLPLPNVWLGVSVEDQARADERIPHLLDTPAAVRWISAEPLLGPVDLTRIPSPVVTPEDEGYYHSALERGDIHHYDGEPDVLTGRKIVDSVDGPMMERIDWVVAGGESGRGSRPVHPDWIRSLRDQCAAAEVPYFFKQWGGVNKKEAGALLDGREHREFPT